MEIAPTPVQPMEPKFFETSILEPIHKSQRLDRLIQCPSRVPACFIGVILAFGEGAG
jgi:hypothetical protein